MPGESTTVSLSNIQLPSAYPAGRYQFQLTSFNKETNHFKYASDVLNKDISIKLYQAGDKVCAIDHNQQAACFGLVWDRSRDLPLPGEPVLPITIPMPENLIAPEKILAGNWAPNICVWDQGEFKCIGDERNLPFDMFDYPPLLNPGFVTTSNQHLLETCVIDESPKKIQCWGGNSHRKNRAMPDFSQRTPIELAVTEEATCALIEGTPPAKNTIECWKEYSFSSTTNINQTLFPDQVNPTHVWSNESYMCAVDDGKAKCNQYKGWQEGWSPVSLPQLSGVTQLHINLGTTSGKEVFCAKHDEGLGCWTLPDFTPVYEEEIAALSNPSQISVQFDYACAVDDNGVSCWGEAMEHAKMNLEHGHSGDPRYDNYYWAEVPQAFKID